MVTMGRHQSRNEAYQVEASRRSNEGRRREKAGQNVSLRPSWAAKGTPTVVPGPKKSPRAPAGTSNCLPLVTGTEHVGSGQSAVTFARLFTGMGRALMSPTELLPGLSRLRRLKNSMKGG